MFSSVFDFIIPPVKASNTNFVYALNLPKKILICVGSSSPWIRVFLSSYLNLSHAWLNDSSQSWRNEEIFGFPWLTFDCGKNLCRNFVTTSFHTVRLFSGEECYQTLVLPANVKGNKLTQIASLGTWWFFTILQVFKNVAKWLYGFSWSNP